MKGLPALVLTYVFNALAVASTDYAPGIYCNIVTQTWHEAVKDCKDKGGYLVSYVTGIGKTVDELRLKEDIDVWTADYAWEPENGFSSASYEKLCGFDYLNSTFSDPPEELFGYCDEIRNYLCKNTSTSKLDVRNGTRESAQCNEVIQDSDLNDIRNNIIPGYYWTSHILYWTTDTGPSLPKTKHVLCGAYKKTVGKYFIDCDKRRFSLCQITDLTEWKGPIYKQCFSGQSTTINALYSIGNTTVKSVAGVSKSIERTTGTSRILPVTESISDRNVSKVSTEEGAEQRTEQEHYSNIDVKVGAPVAILLALICGSVISIYLFRRRNNAKKKSPVEPPQGILKDETRHGKQNDYESLDHIHEYDHSYNTIREVEETKS